MSAPGIEYRPVDRRHVEGVMRLCRVEGWPSYIADEDQTWRALTAPGSFTIVALARDSVVGFAQLQSDGVIQAHLTLIAVDGDQRRRGIGRRLVREALARSGAQRIDLLSTGGAEGFYESFAHRRFPGYRIYPDIDPGVVPP